MLETQGIPAVAICTADFLAGGRMQAASMRLPDIPIVSVPQHYITNTPEQVRALADSCVEDVLKYLVAT